MFKAEKRLTVNGFLAAFEGEEMTDAEAERRGINTAAPAPAKKPAAVKNQRQRKPRRSNK